MKKLKNMLLMLGLASLVVFASCSKDEDETIEDAKITLTARKVVGNTATIIASGATLNQGDSVYLEYKFEGNDKNKLKSYIITGSWETTPINQGNLTGTSQTVVEGGIVDFAAGAYTITSVLTTDKGTVTNSFSFTVVGGGSGGSYIINSINFDLGNQADALAKFWSGKRSTETTPATYFLSNMVGNADLQADIDFGYVSRSAANGGNKLVGPNSNDATAIYADQWSNAGEKITNWTNRNNTMFRLTTLTQATFNTALDSAAIEVLIAQALTAGEPSNPSIFVENEKVYLYKTQAGLYGLILVINPTGEVNAQGNAVAGTVTCIAKYQKGI